jgi:CHAD domain-containing protein
MAYRFIRKDRSVETALRRIAVEQIDGAIAAITGIERAAAVHDIRKCCKKLRALVRLVRPSFANHARENAAIRDIAALVSAARDAQVMLDTLDALAVHCHDDEGSRKLAAVRRHLAGSHGRAAAVQLDEILEDVLKRLVQARERARRWDLRDKGWSALSGGLARYYGGARKAAEAAAAHPGMESFHELRKRLKDHWYHCRLLVPLWPSAMAVRGRAAGELADLLGEHHDLWILEECLAAGIAVREDRSAAELAIALAAQRRTEIEKQAWPAIERLLAQPPGELAAYWGRLWAAWRGEGNLESRLASH